MSDTLRLPDDWEQLVETAREVRSRAYAPYSGFSVGAALRMAGGQVFTGCNVENVSYGLTICAERVAMCSAVAAGVMLPEVICVSLEGQPVPCGSCRQLLYEFNPNLLVLLDNCAATERPECVHLDVLLPRAFVPEEP